MKKTWAVTIGREFCSGGAAVAHKAAEFLGIPYYDKDIIDHAVNMTNLSLDEVIQQDENAASLRRNAYSYTRYSGDPELILPTHLRVYEAQCDAIRRFVGEGPCIIIGRCGDYVLGELDRSVNALNVFIHAPMSLRVSRGCEIYGWSPEEAKKKIIATDKIRAKYYNSHTGRSWGDMHNYDMILNTGKTGIEGAARIIAGAIDLVKEN